MMDNIVGIIKSHKFFGRLLLPYVVERKSTKYLSIKNLLSTEELDDADRQIEWVQSLHKIGQSLEPQALMKRFSNNHSKFDQFYNGLITEVREKMLLPFVWQQIDTMVSLMSENGIHIYSDKDWPNLYPDNRIYPETHSAELIMYFDRTGNETLYKLALNLGSEKIDLQASGNFLLTKKPCHLMVGNRLLKLENIENGKLLQAFFSKQVIHIPKRAEKQYFERFIRKAANFATIRAVGFDVQDIDVKPIACLSMVQNWTGAFGLTLSFDYGERVVRANSEQKTFTNLHSDHKGFVFRRFKRDLTWEKAQIETLKRIGFEQEESFFTQRKPAYIVLFGFLEHIIQLKPEFDKHNFILKQELPDAYVLQNPKVSIKTIQNPDWFDLQIYIHVGEYSIPFMALKDHLLKREKKFQLPSGEYFIVPDEWFARYNGILIHSTEAGERVRLSRYHFKLLEALQTDMSEESLDKNDITNPSAPVLENVSLRPYQLTGFQWLYHLVKRKFGAVLADDMGLGKTLQTIALLAHFFEKDKYKAVLPMTKESSEQQLDLFTNSAETDTTINPETPPFVAPTLLVVPTSLIHNWKNEIDRFAPWLKVYIYKGSKRTSIESVFDGYHIILTTYGTLRNDIDSLKNHLFTFLILDESQAIKNPASQSALAAYALRGKHHIVLTGTPIENRLTDLWAQMHFVNHGLLGSLNTFNKEYVQVIQKNPSSHKTAQLQKLIEPFILRRTKEQVAPELPPLTETTVFCEMTENQYKLYESEKSRYRNLILESIVGNETTESTSVKVLEALMKLRLIANHPHMANQNWHDESGKFEQVTEQLQSLVTEKQKVLLFSSFVRHLKLYEQYCIENKIDYALLTGATTNREREIDAFRRQDGAQVFLISLKAGGVGLNLTEAAYVFLLDPWWNPAAEMQAISRAHRIGQNKNVFAYRFISKDSIEEKIQLLQKRKKELARTFVPEQDGLNELGLEALLSLLE